MPIIAVWFIVILIVGCLLFRIVRSSLSVSERSLICTAVIGFATLLTGLLGVLTNKRDLENNQNGSTAGNSAEILYVASTQDNRIGERENSKNSITTSDTTIEPIEDDSSASSSLSPDTDAFTSSAEGSEDYVWLSDLDPMDKAEGYSYYSDWNMTLNTGEKVKRVICCVVGSGTEATYYLNGEYDSFSGYFGVNQENFQIPTDEAGHVEIYADGNLVVHTKRVGTLDEPDHFETDITGCKKLRVYFANAKMGYYNLLYDVRLHKTKEGKEQ